MANYRLKKGYDIRMAGGAEAILERAPFPESVGLYPADFYGMTPKPLVEGGERVRIGTPLWRDKRRESLIVTSPASGTVAEVRRGERRALESVIIRTDGKAARRRINRAAAKARLLFRARRDHQRPLRRRDFFPSSVSAPSARSPTPWRRRAPSSLPPWTPRRSPRTRDLSSKTMSRNSSVASTCSQASPPAGCTSVRRLTRERLALRRRSKC